MAANESGRSPFELSLRLPQPNRDWLAKMFPYQWRVFGILPLALRLSAGLEILEICGPGRVEVNCIGVKNRP